MFGFAGLWERWKDRASGQAIQSCTIITTTPNEVGTPIHDRMPVILEPKDYAQWLGEEPTEPSHLMMMLKRYPAAAMEVYPVSSRVGNVARVRFAVAPMSKCASSTSTRGANDGSAHG